MIEVKAKQRADELLARMPKGNARVYVVNNINLSVSQERKEFFKLVLKYINQTN